MQLLSVIQEWGKLTWVSKSGNRQSTFMNLSTVKQCFKFILPDTSWMKEPSKSRMDFVNWIPNEILEQEFWLG